MKWLKVAFARVRALVFGKSVQRDIDQELQSHIEITTEWHISRGLSPDEARQQAIRSFGNAVRVKEKAHEVKGGGLIEELLQDIRYAARMLKKSPGLTATVILTIALCIGATTAIFSVVDATLLQPLPYPQSDQLVSIRADLPGVGAQDVGMSQPEWRDLQQSGIFQYVSPTWFDENNLTGSSLPERVRIMIVAPNYFALLGVKPQLGQTFNPEDYSPGLLLDVVISDGLWKRSFGGDPNVLGKSIRMDTDLYRIIGVMPPGFDAPGRTAEERNIEIWAATSFYGAPMYDQPPRSGRNLPTAIARLKPGLTIEAAQSRLDALVSALRQQFSGDYPAQNAWTMRLVPLKERVVGNIRQPLIMLLGAVGLVLMIGCVNVANLLLARSSARGREMAIRQSLGASRRRLTRQLLTESVLLSVLGGTAGLAILFCAKGFLLRLIPDDLPRLNDITISWSVLLFAVVASLATGVIFGLAPALQAGRVDLTYGLKEAARGSTGSGGQSRTRRVLVITEFALSLVLMISAGLLLRSFRDLLNVSPGFNPQNVMSIRTRLPYPNDLNADNYGTNAQKASFFREVIRRVKALPGVEEVAMSDPGAIPLDENQRNLKVIYDGHFLFTVEGHSNQGDSPSIAQRSSVTAEYFHLLGIPLLRGRLFNDMDDDKSPQVALINEAFAQTYWPGQEPLGKRFKEVRANSPWFTVVGVLANARTESLSEASIPQIYVSLYQVGEKHLAIFIRGRLDTAAIPNEVREQVQTVDPTLPVFNAQTLDETVSASLSQKRFSMEMVALFAATALLLAGLGIYGVISYMVTERTNEIGIRIALGAQRQHILHMVLRQGLGLAIAGATVGLVCALIVSRLMAGLLFGVRPADPLTFAGVAILLIGVALLACYVPARRAIRVDPMTALRHE